MIYYNAIDSSLEITVKNITKIRKTIQKRFSFSKTFILIHFRFPYVVFYEYCQCLILFSIAKLVTELCPMHYYWLDGLFKVYT